MRRTYIQTIWLQIITIPISGIAVQLWLTARPLVVLIVAPIAFTYFAFVKVMELYHQSFLLHTQVKHQHQEIQIAHDKLTSAHTDLQQKNRELKATHQELNTALTQLQQKNHELELTHDELSNAHNQLQQLQASRTREVVNAAHDLKHAITAIRERIEQTPFAGELRGRLRSANELLEDILLAGSLRDPEFELQPRQIELTELLGEVFEELPASVARLQLYVRDRHNPTWVDPPRIKRVLRNVIINARKAGASQIDVTVCNTGEMIAISIADDGSGMDATTLAAVQQRFTRGGQGNGYGIGLHAAATLVTLSGGQLTIDSPGHQLGTTVTLYLPTSGAEG